MFGRKISLLFSELEFMLKCLCNCNCNCDFCWDFVNSQNVLNILTLKYRYAESFVLKSSNFMM